MLGDNADDGGGLANVVRAGYGSEYLLGYFEDRRRLNLERDKLRTFDASHVGTVFIEREGDDCQREVEKIRHYLYI